MSKMSNGALLTDPIRGISDAADPEFEEHVLEKVDEDDDSFTLSFDDGTCIGLAKSYGVVPLAGQTIRTYGRGFGWPCRGVAVNGVIAYHRTPAEQEAKQRADIEDSKARKRAKFEDDREGNDRRIAALPSVFRERFARFLRNNPDFRWEFEGYELFCCEDAVRLAARAKEMAQYATPAAWIREFAKASSDTQKKLAPAMKIEDHSGNTFGFTCQLAHAYLEDESLVPRMHGALANLVGCEEYGCPPEPAAEAPAAE
jgi:hypothetical protein